MIDNLTPPVKAHGTVTTPKPAKEPKPPKEPKAAKEPKPPKEPKMAKPRGIYGYHLDSVIEVIKGKEATYKGQRGAAFAVVKDHDGKKVSDFNAAMKGRTNGKGTVQIPSGWLRFFALDDSIRLHPPTPVSPVS
jgi:hypothetical protein